MATTIYPNGTPTTPKPAFSLPSILAIIAAVISFRTGAALGFLTAVAAIILGLIGVVLSLLPSVRGGIVSVLSIGAGLVGIIAAIYKLVF